MPKFEVHIPAADPSGFNMTLKVGADNWMAALKAGMQKLGEQGAVTQNVMVDIQEDNSIHITESASGRVFRIRELTDAEAATAPVKRPSGLFRHPDAAVPAGKAKTKSAPLASDNDKTLPPTPAHVPAAAEPFDASKTIPGGFEVPKELQPAPVAPKPSYEQVKTSPPGPGSKPGLAEPKAPLPATVVDRSGSSRASPPPDPSLSLRSSASASARLDGRQTQSKGVTHKSTPRVEVGDVEELEHPVKPVTGAIGRPKTNPGMQASIRQQTEDILADVFMRITDFENLKTFEEAMAFLLDLAMQKVPCEAGSVLRSDSVTGDLHFVVARGPRADELMKQQLVIPASEGIAGFCAAEGVSVALGDAQRDPRYYAEVGEKIEYQTKSMLCAPMMTHGRSFGCVQLINRKSGTQFLEHEMGVLAYLSHQGALYLNKQG